MMKISRSVCPVNREQDYTHRTVKCLFRNRKIGLCKQTAFLKFVSLWQLKYVASNLYGLIIIIIIIIVTNLLVIWYKSEATVKQLRKIIPS